MKRQRYRPGCGADIFGYGMQMVQWDTFKKCKTGSLMLGGTRVIIAYNPSVDGGEWPIIKRCLSYMSRTGKFEGCISATCYAMVRTYEIDGGGCMSKQVRLEFRDSDGLGRFHPYDPPYGLRFEFRNSPENPGAFCNYEVDGYEAWQTGLPHRPGVPLPAS